MYILHEWTNGHDICQKLRYNRGYASKLERYHFQT